MTRYLLGLAGLLTASAALPASAGEALRDYLAARPGARAYEAGGELLMLRDPAAPAYPGAPAEAARAYLADLATVLDSSRLGAPEVLFVAGRTLVRFPEERGGVRVLGRGVVVALDAGRPTMLLRAAALAAPPAEAPAFDAARAGDLARAAAGLPGDAPARAALVFWPAGAGYRLAYAVDTKDGLATERLLIDAKTGRLLFRESRVFSARGHVWEGSPQADKAAPLLEVELPPLTSATPEQGLLGDFVMAINCEFTAGDRLCDPIGNAFPDALGDLFFEPVLAASDPEFRFDPFAQAHAYYHTDQIHAFFSALGATSDIGHFINPSNQLASLDEPLPVITNARVDVNGDGIPDPLSNAFFNGYEMVLGDGHVADMAYDADVIYHEYTHAVIGFRYDGTLIDRFGINAMNPALGEGVADAFAAIKTGNPVIGEYAGLNAGGIDGLRSLDNDNCFPFDLVAERHEDGKIWGGALWSIRGRLLDAFGPALGEEAVLTLLARIHLGAIYGVAGSYPDFADAALALLAFAHDIGGEVGLGDEIAEIFREEFVARGIVNADLSAPARVVPLDAFARDSYEQNFFGDDAFGLDAGVLVPSSIQYSVTLKPGERLRADVRAERDDRLPAAFTVLRREGRPVEYVDEGVGPFGFVADAAFELPAQLAAENRGGQPSTFFFALGVNDPQDGTFFIENVVIEDATDFAGGGCAAAPGGSDVAALLLAALALSLAWLRRRG
jgi:hypothetical protein